MVNSASLKFSFFQKKENFLRKKGDDFRELAKPLSKMIYNGYYAEKN